MTPTDSPYVCAVCRAPVTAGARFCAQCGTPFSERPPLRVAPPPVVTPSTPGAVPVAPPPLAYGPASPSYRPAVVEPEPARSTAGWWVGGIALLFIGALVAAYLLFAEPVDRDDDAPVIVETPREPSGRLPPPVSADADLDDGSFPTDEEISLIDEMPDEPPPAPTLEPEPEPAPEPPAEPEPAPEPNAQPAPDGEELGAAWSTYQDATAAYQRAVRAAGTTDKARAEIATACRTLLAAGDAVLRLPGRERYAGQIARERRAC